MISVCMAYRSERSCNRYPLFQKTVEELNRCKLSPDEVELVVVVDYGEMIPFIECKYPVNLHNLADSTKTRTWVNPCVAFNKAFEMAKGDIVVVQNPEVYYVGDVLSYVKDNLQRNTWMSFSCVALNEFQEVFMWYNHPVYRPVAYHFCAAVYKEDMCYFDKDYRYGTSYDDDDLIDQMKHQGLQLAIVPPSEGVSVVHQWHPSIVPKDVETNAKLFAQKKQQRRKHASH